MSYIATNIYVCAKVCGENYTGQMEEEMTNNSLPKIIMEIENFGKQ
jgi:hypothetical protein